MDTELPDGVFDETLLVKRKIAWDIIPHDEVPATLDALGMVVGDQDVLDLEHQESHARQSPLLPMSLFVQAFTALATDVYSTAYLRPVEDEDLGAAAEEIKQRFLDQNFEIARAVVFAVLGQLVENGFLQPGGTVVLG
jgi:hypothetical protein